MNEKRHAKRRLPATLLAILVLVLLFPVSARADPAPLTLVSAAVTTGGGVGLTFDRALSEADFVNRIKDGFTITGLDRTPPIMNASRIISSLCGGPMVTAVTVEPGTNFFSCSAVSNPYRSYGLSLASMPSRFNTPVFGSTSTFAVPGTCLIHTAIFIPLPL